MNIVSLSVPAFVATVLFISSMVFMPVRLQAAAKGEDDSGMLRSSSSDNTACDLPPYSELLDKEGPETGIRLAEMPPLDSKTPSRVSTATFAMG